MYRNRNIGQVPFAMRIAAIYPHVSLVSPSSPDNALAVVLWETARRLARTDESTLVVNGSAGGDRTEVLQGVRLIRIPVLADQILGQARRLDGIIFRDPKRPFRSTPLYYRVFLGRTARRLKSRTPDIVHVHAIPNFLPTLRQKLPKTRLVLHAHDHRLADYDPAVVSGMLEHADLILGCSRFVTRTIARQFPTVAARCSHLYNGADERFLAVGRDRTRLPQNVLYVGRLSPEKGVHTLIEAFCSVADEFPDATLEIVGPDALAPLQFVDPRAEDRCFDRLRGFFGDATSYGRYLRNLVPAALSSRVRFIGPIANESLPGVFARAGLFAFPSLWNEPFGMPVIEAMGSGLPVVATESGAISETVDHGSTGLLVERGSTEALAGALRQLLKSDQLRQRMSAAAFTRAESDFQWDTIVENLRAKYLSLLQTALNAGSRFTGTPPLASRSGV